MRRRQPRPTIEQLDALAAKYSDCQSFDEFCEVAPLVDAKCANHQLDRIREVQALRRAYKWRTGKNLTHSKGYSQKGSPPRRRTIQRTAPRTTEVAVKRTIPRMPETAPSGYVPMTVSEQPESMISGYVPLTAHDSHFEDCTRRGL